MILIAIQTILGFLVVSQIVLIIKGYISNTIFTIVFYALFNLTIVLSTLFRKEKEQKKITLQFMILRIISTLCVQIGYVTITPNNHDILLQKPVIDYILQNGMISYNITDYNYTNSSQYAQYPITEILILILHFFTNIQISYIQKYLAVSLSFLIVIPVLSIITTLFKNRRVAWISTYIFIQTPWLIFFHSHIVHEFLGITFLLYYLNYALKLKDEHIKINRTFIETMFICIIVFTHHYTSLFLATILFIQFLIQIAFNKRKSRLLCFSLYKVVLSISLIFIWGLRSNNRIFRAIFLWIWDIFNWYIINLFFAAVGSFIFLILFLLLNKKFNYKEKISNTLSKFHTFTKHNMLIILVYELFIIVFLPIILIQFELIKISNILSKYHYFFIGLALITVTITYINGFILFSINNSEKMRNKNLIFYRIQSLLFSFLLVIFYFFVTWIRSVNVKERVQILAFFFMSGYSGYFLFNLQKIDLKKIASKIRTVITCILLVSLSLGSMFYSFKIDTVSNSTIIYSADDYRLYPNDWENIALWMKKNDAFFEDKVIYSTYRGKIFIEGYTKHRVFEGEIGIMLETFNETGKLKFFVGIYVIHVAMLEYPFLGSKEPMPYLFWSSLINKSIIICSTSNIKILYYTGG